MKFLILLIFSLTINCDAENYYLKFDPITTNLVSTWIGENETNSLSANKKRCILEVTSNKYFKVLSAEQTGTNWMAFIDYSKITNCVAKARNERALEEWKKVKDTVRMQNKKLPPEERITKEEWIEEWKSDNSWQSLKENK